MLGPPRPAQPSSAAPAAHHSARARVLSLSLRALARPRLSRRPRASRPDASDKEADGRRLRAARNYEAVVGAVLDIVRECPPNAIYLRAPPRSPARARVSERTVFRHFADLNALFVAAASRIRPIQQIYLGPRPDAPTRGDRIEELVSSALEALRERSRP